MRLRFAFALVALAALAACDRAATPKGASSARAPIGAATTPATATAKADLNCPKVAPACPPQRKAATARHATTAHAKPAVAARQASRRTVAKVEPQRVAEADPDAALGLPSRPYRYDELAPRYERHRHEHRAGAEDFHHRRHYDDAYADDRQGRADDDDLADAEERGYRERRVESRPAPPRREGYAERYGAERYETERHAHEGYSTHRGYESYSETRSTSNSYAEGPCCEAPRAQAAGFDARGYLTWPGKVPAR